jgi:menaquinone-dependent protoporphyrinogen IX oxidase
VISAEEHTNLEKYDLIIAGTSIHATRTVSSFRKFLKSHLNQLSQKKVAYFVSCANMMNDTDESRNETLDWFNKAITPFGTIQPLSIGLFGGATVTSGEKFQKLNIFAKRIILAMEKNMLSEYGKTDFRDWEKIRLWASALIASLNN